MTSEHTSEGRLLVAVDGGIAWMRVIGRGTFKLADGMSRWIQELLELPELKSVVLDMAECSSLDSTFMGLMVTLAVKTRGTCALLVVNADKPEHHRLLDGIGVMRAWRYTDVPVGSLSWKSLAEATVGTVTLDERMRKLILSAHETLVAFDPSQEPKFRDVIEIMKAEEAE